MHQRTTGLIGMAAHVTFWFLEVILSGMFLSKSTSEARGALSPSNIDTVRMAEHTTLITPLINIRIGGHLAQHAFRTFEAWHDPIEERT